MDDRIIRSDYLHIFQQDNLYGIKDIRNGEIITPAIYHKILKITPCVYQMSTIPDFLIALEKMKPQGVCYDYFSTRLSRKIGSFTSYKLESSRIKLIKKSSNIYNEQYCYIDTDGSNLTEIRFSTNLLKFCDGLAQIPNAKRKYGYVNEEGILIIPFIYDSAGNFNKNLAIVQEQGQYGVIDKSGEVIIDFKYDDIWKLDDKVFFGKIGNSGYVISLDNKEQILLPFCDYSGSTDKYIIGKNTDKKYGIVTYSGKIIIPFDYDMIYLHNQGFELQKGEQYALIDKNCSIAIRDWSEDTEEYYCERYNLSSDFFEEHRRQQKQAQINWEYQQEQANNNDEWHSYNGFTQDEVDNGLADAFEDDYNAYLSRQ